MNISKLSILIVTYVLITSCADRKEEKSNILILVRSNDIYAKEPEDSAGYIHVKHNFYLTKAGQLCERKLASARDSSCNCLFEVYYDSTFKVYTDDSVITKPLNTIVDIKSFVQLDSSEFSKDKKNVFYYHNNSDGGNRTIVANADIETFKRLCEYHWGIDKNHVFYKNDILRGFNLRKIQILYPLDTSDHFVQYIKNDKMVFFENTLVEGADAKTFKLVTEQRWDAEDKNHKYENGRSKE